VEQGENDHTVTSSLSGVRWTDVEQCLNMLCRVEVGPQSAEAVVDGALAQALILKMGKLTPDM